jgi:hypothetical protein
VQIFLDTRVVVEVPTDQPRADVQRRYPGAPLNCGYVVTVPAAIGERLICVWGVDPGTRTRNLIDARDVVVTQPAPPPPPPPPPPAEVTP